MSKMIAKKRGTFMNLVLWPTSYCFRLMSMSLTDRKRENCSLCVDVFVCVLETDCLFFYTLLRSELHRLRPLTQRLHSLRIVGTFVDYKTERYIHSVLLRQTKSSQHTVRLSF